jgi:hypothetical protein
VLPAERAPEPITRLSEADGGSIKIDGAHVVYKRPPKPEPTIVPAEIRPMGGPIIVLEGGPADGRECRVPRGQNEHRMPAPQSDRPGPTFTEKKVGDRVIRQTVVHGDFAAALYARTDRRDEDGRAIFEFVGVE